MVKRSISQTHLHNKVIWCGIQLSAFQSNPFQQSDIGLVKNKYMKNEDECSFHFNITYIHRLLVYSVPTQCPSFQTTEYFYKSMYNIKF